MKNTINCNATIDLDSFVQGVSEWNDKDKAELVRDIISYIDDTKQLDKIKKDIECSLSG